jgi:hypothetical protein
MYPGKPRPSISVTSPVICVNTNINIVNTSGFGNVITPGPNFAATCSESAEKVWEIVPATGYVINNGKFGSLNNNVADGSKWTDGK